MKKIKIILLVLIGILTCLGFAACEKPPQILQAPQNLRMEENKLIWDEVENASGYSVYFFGEENEVTENFFDFSDLEYYNAPFDVEVLAIGNQTGYLDSDWVKTSCTLFDYSYGLRYIPTEDGTGYNVGTGKNTHIEGEIYIPDYYNGLPVKGICYGGFAAIPNYNTRLHTATAVRLPETLESIGERAFSGCYFIQVKIPDGVTSIGEKAFENCPYLVKLEFSENSSLKTIGESAFRNCPYIVKLSFPASLEAIENYAFENGKNLRMIEFPSSSALVRLGAAFTNCTSLAKVALPSSLKTLKGTFSGCKLLNNVTLPAGVTLKGSFRNCTSLTKIDCSQCAEVGSGTFEGCTALTEIIFPEDMSKFCPTAVFAPIGITASTNAAWYDNQPDGLVIVNGALLRYKGDMPENLAITVPEGVDYISDSAFDPLQFINPHSNLVSIEIPDGVKLGAGVFGNCNSLKHVHLPSDLKEIPKKTFYGCSSLESLEIPEGVVKIGESAFMHSAITKFYLPFSLEIIEENAFDCQSPVSVYFKGNVQSVHQYTFNTIKEIIAPVKLFSISNFDIKDETVIYYLGTEAEWNEQAEKFPAFNKGTHYFYVENEDDLPADGGNYWHYGQDGKTPVVWNTGNS